ncbi:MAG: hypothetical protein LBG84_06640 [Treponema sp.]|jgi:hypothetical protein|nr:hypothetical protein [Treponema sp.]
MAHTKDFVPDRDAEFDGWLANLTGYVEGKTGGPAPGWTHIPAAKVAELKQRDADWRTAFARTTGPHTPVDTEAKNDARRAAEGFVRPFVAQYLKFEPVTNEDRTAMRLHNRDTTHSSIERPGTRALIAGLRALGGFQVEARFHDEAAPDRRARPYGTNGCLLNYVLAPEKVMDYAKLKDTALMTHSPFVLSLGPEAEGRFLSCAARWQSERGELGPWGDIQHVVVS